MTTLQEQARALGDPTRHAIFQYLAAAAQPVDVAELTDHFGLNHNAIRQHLAKLVDAGLVTEGQATGGGRGRPYERLSVLLTEILRTGDTAYEVGKRSVGNAAPAAGEDPVSLVVDVMERQGFDPEVRNDRGRKVDVVLRTCPFESAVLADPDTICDLHLGMAEGVAELSGHRLVLDELVVHDPRRAGCRLRMHREPEGEG
jgi:predicted ArsR family transcriptional regulator